MRKNSWTKLIFVAFILLVMNPLSVQALQNDNNTDNVDHDWMSNEELIQKLNQIEKASSNRVDVDVIGHSHQGREIYAARVGTGDQVLLINGNIHGNEKSGPEALVQMLETLGTSDSTFAQAIRDEVTIVAVPRLNVDGADITQRQNIFSWNDVMNKYPQLNGTTPSWYYSETNGGFDVNRDFNPNLSYEPEVADLPGTGADPGFFLTNESRILRNVYLNLKDEFGEVEAFVDLHHMGTPETNKTGEDVTIAIDYPPLGPEDSTKYADWPKLDQDKSKRYALAAALGVKEFSDREEPGVARYLHPEERDLPGQARSSFALNGTATVLFEMPGQQPEYGYDQALIDRVENGLWGIATRMADGSIDQLNGDQFLRLPKYWTERSSDMKILVERFLEEGKIENESAAHSLSIHLMMVNIYEEREEGEKVVKHMRNFKLLLDHQNEEGLIAEDAYNRLHDDADYLIEKW
ncbi:M14 family zinc carboxypeptidase [Virgibacillus salexigens]|uniref:Zinc carboxypeptidase n=1 Tax=Virgibacillus massiliensis TaxID=1462526 RepID=A0A024Q8Y6_9BACI|nr:M14 family zinc carboxypeptidase [Virgibacillus massiliensis]CDQ38752.1 Zinc carboxypeptidase [Virgibacillus massiliensis]